MKKKILIVEDEMIIALDLKKTLKNNGFNILGITNSHEDTIEFLNHLIYKEKDILILMDINIKGPIDGIQSCNIIFHKYKLPILFISAHYDKEVLSMIKDSYAIGFITKPIKYEQLLLNLHFTLNKKEQISKEKKKEKICLNNDFSFNTSKNTLYLDNKEICLTKIEKRIIFLLAKNKYNYVSYENLFSYVWGEGNLSLNKIRGTIFRLKRKVPLLEIKNNKEHGYKLD